MQVYFAHSENTGVSTGAIAGILHDLCQPLTALECSLELALMPCSAAKARSFTTAALQAARRLHALAIQAQAIEGLCRQYRRPRVLSLADFAGQFGLALLVEDSSKNIYVDTDGLHAAFRRLGFGGAPHGSIKCAGSVIHIAFEVDDAKCYLQSEAQSRDTTLSPTAAVSALIEHLGGRLTLSKDIALIEFLTH